MSLPHWVDGWLWAHGGSGLYIGLITSKGIWGSGSGYVSSLQLWIGHYSVSRPLRWSGPRRSVTVPYHESTLLFSCHET